MLVVYFENACNVANISFKIPYIGTVAGVEIPVYYKGDRLAQHSYQTWDAFSLKQFVFMQDGSNNPIWRMIEEDKYDVDIAGDLTVNGDASFAQTPTAPTAAAGTSDTQLATTEFVANEMTKVKGNNEASYRTGEVNLTPANILGTSTSSTYWQGDNTWARKRIFYGTCSVTGATAEKAVTCPEYDTLTVGDIIVVTFSALNSAGVANITLKVNTTEAKPIKYMYNNAVNNIPSAGYLLAQTYIFHYDGTNWVIDNMHYNTNSTYSAASATPSAVATTAAVGTSAKYAREDHVHNISLATGDNAGQVKIAGTNISVNGWSDKADLNSPEFTGTPTAPTPTAGDSSTQIATTEFVADAVSSLSGPMRFMGTAGTGGAVTSSTIPEAAAANEGYTYKVITDGTYQGVVAKVGDLLVSDGSNWILIPAGDEPGGTVTSVTLKAGSGIAIDTDNTAITTSGTRTISHADTSNVANVTAANRTYVKSLTFDTYGHVTAVSTGTETVTNTDRYVNSAAFADDTTATAASPVKMTLTRAGSDTQTVTANIPKVSSTSAGVAPKGTTVSSQSQSTKFLREDGTWAAPSYTTNASSATALKNGGRKTDANITHVTDGGMTLFLATSSMTSNKPDDDGYILHFNWDGNTSSAWDAQLFVPDVGTNSMQWRGHTNATTWQTGWNTLLDDNNYNDYTVKKKDNGTKWGVAYYSDSNTITTTGQGAANNALMGNGAAAPKWTAVSTTLSHTAGTGSAASKLKVTVLGVASSEITLTTATTGVYGMTKLSSATDSTSTTLAATPSAVKAAYDLADDHKYWANVEATSAAAYDKQPEVKSVTFGNGSGATAATIAATVQYNTTDDSLDFIFV